MTLGKFVGGNLRVAIAAGISALLLCIVSITLWHRHRALPQDEAASIPSNVKESSMVLGDVHSPKNRQALLRMLPTPRGGLAHGARQATGGEVQAFRAAKQALQKAWESREASRAKHLLDKEAEGNFGLMVAITAPSAEEISEMATEFTAALESLPKESAIYATAYSEFSNLFFDHIDYPDKVKFVGISTKTDPNDKSPRWGDVFIVEYFAPTEEDGTPSEAGEIPVEQDKIRTDTKWNSTQSWARKRYGFLLEIVEEDVDGEELDAPLVKSVTPAGP